jgi:HAD superfamily hydrolase (TIGR01509 family)
MNPQIKAICFDLDGVYFTPRGKKSFHQALSAEFGAKLEVVDELMYRSPEMAQLVRGQLSPEEFWSKVRVMTGITASDDELAERWIRDYEVDENVHRSVLRAKDLGYKTCVCTNNNVIRLNPLIEHYKLHEIFDVIVSSHEVGEMKPNRAIFEELISKLGIQAEELVYSDDNAERLGGASEMGIKTFVFENFGQFLEELKKLGIDLS